MHPGQHIVGGQVQPLARAADVEVEPMTNIINRTVQAKTFLMFSLLVSWAALALSESQVGKGKHSPFLTVS
jgi:hypothetical protein